MFKCFIIIVEIENLFSSLFFNMDFSLDKSKNCLKFRVCILHNDTEGTVSQNCHLSCSFHFIKSRIIFFKN